MNDKQFPPLNPTVHPKSGKEMLEMSKRNNDNFMHVGSLPAPVEGLRADRLLTIDEQIKACGLQVNTRILEAQDAKTLSLLPQGQGWQDKPDKAGWWWIKSRNLTATVEYIPASWIPIDLAGIHYPNSLWLFIPEPPASKGETK